VANAIMDAVAHDRRAQGLPALSLNWGPWAEAGLAAGMSERNRERLAARGMDFIPPEQGLAALEALIALPLAQAAVFPVNWERYLADLPDGVPTHLFEAFRRGQTQPQLAFLAELESAPPARHRALLDAFIREQIARALGLPDPGQIGARQRLFDLGVDSLMAVELRNRLEAGLKRPLRATLLFDFPRLDALTQHLADEVLHLAPSSVDPVTARANGAFLPATEDVTTAGDLDPSSLDQLSPGDLGSMVEEKLAAMARFLDEEP
jgi:acyl carrier protein